MRSDSWACILIEQSRPNLTEGKSAKVGGAAHIQHRNRARPLFALSALLDALAEGRLGGAALDVFASERAPLEDHVVSLCR